MQLYKENKGIKLSWDKMQTLFECCGSHNYTEWTTITGNIPRSCYSADPPQSDIRKVPSQLYIKSCFSPFMEHMEHEIKSKCTAGLVLCILSIVLISCIPFSMVIILLYRKHHSSYTHSKPLIRRSLGHVHYKNKCNNVQYRDKQPPPLLLREGYEDTVTVYDDIHQAIYTKPLRYRSHLDYIHYGMDRFNRPGPPSATVKCTRRHEAYKDDEESSDNIYEDCVYEAPSPTVKYRPLHVGSDMQYEAYEDGESYSEGSDNEYFDYHSDDIRKEIDTKPFRYPSHLDHTPQEIYAQPSTYDFDYMSTIPSPVNALNENQHSTECRRQTSTYVDEQEIYDEVA